MEGGKLQQPGRDGETGWRGAQKGTSEPHAEGRANQSTSSWPVSFSIRPAKREFQPWPSWRASPAGAKLSDRPCVCIHHLCEGEEQMAGERPITERCRYVTTPHRGPGFSLPPCGCRCPQAGWTDEPLQRVR